MIQFYSFLWLSTIPEASVDHRELSSVLCDDLEGGMGKVEGGSGEQDRSTHSANSRCYTAEMNTTL